MVINTECVVHDAKEAKRYQEMGMQQEPPKERVGFSFHMSDVKTLTQHKLEEGDETELDELCLVSFYSGESVPVAASYADLSEKFAKYHQERDEKINKIVEEKDVDNN